MSKHTPGPWVAKDVPSAGWQIMAKVPQIPDADAVTIYHAHMPSETMLAYEPWVQFPKPWVNEMFEANSKLIAAAPDLLASAKALLEAVVKEYGADIKYKPVAVGQYLDAVADAIAKAESPAA